MDCTICHCQFFDSQKPVAASVIEKIFQKYKGREFQVFRRQRFFLEQRMRKVPQTRGSEGERRGDVEKK
jgi:hypothetical protein